MTSVTMMKYPDGRTETINVLSHFVKNNADVMVFETDKIDNGHKVVGVSYLMDGMYQNIVGSAWDEIKGYLVDILHDRIGNDEYRIVPEEILVTADPYHPLGLRDENRDKIVASYESFKTTVNGLNNNMSKEEDTVVAPIEEQQVVPDNSIQENQTSIINEPVGVESVAPVSIDPFANNPVITENPIEPSVMPEVAPVVGEVPVGVPMPEVGPTIIESSVVDENAVNQDQVIDNPEIVPDIPIINNASDVTSGEIPAVNLDNTIVNPIDNNGVMNNQEVVINDNPVIEPMPMEPVGDVVPAPSEEVVVEDNSNDSDDSIVTSNYMNNIESIKQEILQLTSDYIAKIQSLSDEYTKNMDEKKTKIKEYLEEAKDYRTLAEQTLNKVQEVQAMTSNQNPIDGSVNVA